MNKTIKCPFCNQGIISYNYEPRKIIQKTTGRHRGKNVKGTSVTEETIEVITGCTNCHKTAKEIEAKLKSPSEAPKNKDVLERLKAAGLPTKI